MQKMVIHMICVEGIVLMILSSVWYIFNLEEMRDALSNSTLHV
jgi:hypothetical protein